MTPSYITDDYLQHFIDAALREDVGDGDHSTLASIPADAISKAHLLVKDQGIIAGLTLATRIFQSVDPQAEIELFFADGDRVTPGDVALQVTGSARTILTLERLVLNCLQRMSAIATKTRRYVTLVEGTGVKVLDTRKTTPNFRLLEKWAVTIGGGNNHRLGLFDMIMLKDNHIDMAGGISAAINRTKDYLRAIGKKLPIEIETRDLSEVRQVIETGGVDVIMLDNMEIDDLREAVQLIGGRYKTEASGGITEATIREIAESGVDYISVGALTHAVESMDLSLKAIEPRH